MAPHSTLSFDIEKLNEDEHGNKVTTIRCHGRLVSENVTEIKELVKPLIPLGGRIVVDLSGVSHIDSSGLGAMVSLKASAIKQGYCILEFTNMTPRLLELVSLTNLTQLLKS